MKVRRQYRLRVRQRLMILHFAGLHGPTAAGRRFGVSVGTIQRVFRDIGLPRVGRARKRAPRQMKLFEKAEPGETIQIDVKFVRIARRWAFQYTALDDCTRFRVLRLYRRLHQSSSLAFLAELCRAFPFGIRKQQCATDTSSRLPLCSRSRRSGLKIATSGHDGRSRTGRSNAVTGLTRRNSGSPAIRYVRSGRRGPPRLGRALQPRTLLTGSTRANSGRKARRSHARRRELMPVPTISATTRRAGINLDETQRLRPRDLTRRLKVAYVADGLDVARSF